MEDLRAKKFPDFFKVFFPQKSSQRLSIPNAAVTHFKGLTHQKFILRGHAGQLWGVDVCTVDNYAWFQRGWGKFVKDNCVGVGDFLVFSYAGHFVYDCTILNVSGCEKSLTGSSCVREGQEEELADHAVGEVPFKNVEVDNAGITSIDEDQTSSNPCFEPKFYKRRQNEVNVPSDLIEDYGLKLEPGSEVTLVGTRKGSRHVTGRVWKWKDGRICIKGWSSFCKENNVTTNDIRLCEFLPESCRSDNRKVIKVHLT